MDQIIPKEFIWDLNLDRLHGKVKMYCQASAFLWMYLHLKGKEKLCLWRRGHDPWALLPQSGIFQGIQSGLGIWHKERPIGILWTSGYDPVPLVTPLSCPQQILKRTRKRYIKDFSKWTIAIHSVEPYYLIELEFIFTGYTSCLKDIAFATIFIFKHRFYI